MKRLLLIGGIISMVLPAMAEEPTPNTDLRGYNLLNGSPSNPGKCLGPDGYDGFKKGNVTMLPLYVETCNPGQYYNAMSDTPINSSTSSAGYTWDNGKCLDANSNVINMSEEECLAAVKVDYYYVNACAEVPNGWYYTPVTEEGPTQDPVIENGYLKKTGPEQCPADYRDGSDKYPSTNQYSRTAITDCYRFCGSDEGDKTVSSATLNSLKATNAEYTSDREHYQGDDVCTVKIASCADGFKYVDLSLSSINPTLDSNTNTWNVTTTVDSKSLVFAGTLEAGADNCIASVTSVTFGTDARQDTFSITLPDCSSEDAKLALKKGIALHYANNVVTDSDFCMPNVVNITWNDVANPGDAATCVYGGDLNFPTAPEKENYTFKGWTVGKVGD